MATTLTDAARAEICSSIDEVFTRAVFGLECPFKNGNQIATFFYAAYDPKLVAAAADLRRAGCRLHEISITGFNILEGDNRITFRLNHAPEPSPRMVLPLGPPDRTPHRTTVQMLHQAGISQEDYCAWVEQVSRIDDEITLAREVLRDLLDMANTAGQLKRMVPELQQYLPERIRSELSRQQRNSQLDPRWTGYDRTRVDGMVRTLAMCYLLPPASWSNFIFASQNFTWVRSARSAERLNRWQNSKPRWDR